MAKDNILHVGIVFACTLLKCVLSREDNEKTAFKKEEIKKEREKEEAENN